MLNISMHPTPQCDNYPSVYAKCSKHATRNAAQMLRVCRETGFEADDVFVDDSEALPVSRFVGVAVADADEDGTAEVCAARTGAV